MTSDKRKFSRFYVKFSFFTNEIDGEGINVSNGGFGFLTTEELVPAEDIPFKAEISCGESDKKKYLLEGRGRLLFSAQSFRNNREYYYNGLEFIKLTKESKKSISDLLKYFLESKD